MRITLRFNEEKILSAIFFDNIYRTNQRIQDYMLNRQMQEWIEPFQGRHVNWQGFIEEFSSLLNTRQFVFKIVGTSEVYEQFKNLTEKIIPQNFNITFEFEPAIEETQNLNAEFISQLISMLQDNNSLCAMKLRSLQRVIDKINFSVIYENHRESRFIRQNFDSIIKINSLQISMPLILISENFSENPYSICKQNEVNPEDLIIIAVNDGNDNAKTEISQLKQRYEDIDIFSLTGSTKLDKFELDKIKQRYNSYKKKIFREFISNYPYKIWNDPQTVMNLITEL